MEQDWNSTLFSNIGIKIQNVAKVIFWIDAIMAIFAGIIMFFVGLIELEYYGYLILLAPLVVLIGLLIAWLSVVILYGFGKLIEKTCDNEENTRRILEHLEGHHRAANTFEFAPAEKQKQETTSQTQYTTTVCSVCKFEQPADREVCLRCGAKLTEKEHKTWEGDKSFKKTENNTIICSVCKFEQSADRQACWRCGAKFTEKEHKWLCDNCHNMRSQSPCEFCGKE